jgi:hypothetical protein
MIPTVNKPRNYTSYCVGQIGDTLLSLFGEFRDESTNYHENAKNGYYLNMEGLEWNEITYDNDVKPTPPIIIGNKFLDLHNYIVFENQSETQLGLYIINKENLIVSFWNRGEFAINLSPFVFVAENKVTYQLKTTELLTIDFDDVKKGETTLGQIHLNTSKGISFIWYFAVLVALLIILTLSYYTVKYFKIARIFSNGNNHDDNYLENLTVKILTKKGEIIDLNMLNELLGIDKLTEENRRVKRSKLINEINLRYKTSIGKDLIIRKRHSIDKRYVQYIIGDIDK